MTDLTSPSLESDHSLRTGKIALTIGITGHRDPSQRDSAVCRLQLKNYLQQLVRRYPAALTQVMSALAEGADRLAAEVAIELGLPLVAPLPFPLAEYERDFPHSVSAFRALLAHVPPSKIFEVPPTAQEDVTSGAARDQRYRIVGKYIAAHCHLLVAFWDGEHNHLVGGTAEVVDYKLIAHSTDPVTQTPVIGPVLHLHCRRQNSADGAAHSSIGSKPPTWLYPQGSSQATFDLVCAQLEAHNLACTHS